jgi:hypothetical protein
MLTHPAMDTSPTATIVYVTLLEHRLCVRACAGQALREASNPLFTDVLLELPVIQSVWEDGRTATFLPLRIYDGGKPWSEPADPTFCLTACEPLRCSCDRVRNSHVVHSPNNSMDQSPPWKSDSRSADWKLPAHYRNRRFVSVNMRSRVWGGGGA